MNDRHGRRWAAAAAAVVLLMTAMVLASTPGVERTILAWLTAIALTRSDLDPARLDSAPSNGATVWLVVGTDHRAGLAGEVAHIGNAVGTRADAIALVGVEATDPLRARVLRLPRELQVDTETFGRQRLGALLDHGPSALVDGVRMGTGVPVHHYMEIDMADFVDVVDAVGGIELQIRHPARDDRSGLDLAAGLNHLDGEAALAYARSRNYEEHAGDGWLVTETGDLARIARQQRLVVSLIDRLQQVGPRQIFSVVTAAHVTVDRSAGTRELGRLAAAMAAETWSWQTLAVRAVLPDGRGNFAVPAPAPRNVPCRHCRAARGCATTRGTRGSRALIGQQMTNYVYDAFVSYRRQEPDRTWIQHRLVPRLQAEGLSVCLDDLSFDPGKLLIREMERAVETSRFTVAVMTPAYLVGAFADLEAVMAQHLSLEERTERFVVVMRDATARAPLGTRARLWIDMTDDGSFDVQIGRLVRRLRDDRPAGDPQ